MDDDEQHIRFIHDLFEKLWIHLISEGSTINNTVSLAYLIIARAAEQLSEVNDKPVDENFNHLCKMLHTTREIVKSDFEENARNVKQ